MFGFSNQQQPVSLDDLLAYFNQRAPQLPATHAAVQGFQQPFNNLGHSIGDYYRATTAEATAPPPSLVNLPQHFMDSMLRDARLATAFADTEVAPVHGVEAGLNEAMRQVFGSPSQLPQRRK